MNYKHNGSFTDVYGHTLAVSHWIAGADVPGEAVHAVINPAHMQDVVALTPEADSLQITTALAAAAQALPAWQQAPSARLQVLGQLSDLLASHGPEFARLMSRETGMPRAHSRRQIQALLAEARHLLDSETELLVPGVCGLISTPAFSLTGPGTLILAALKAGQTLVWAPSQSGSATACLLTRFLTAAGLPPGVLNVLYGGSRVEQALLAQLPQGGLQQMAFSGTRADAEPIAEPCERHGVPIRYLYSGASTLVVLPDADLDVVVPAALAATLNPVGATQLLVHRKIRVAFQRRLLAAAEKWCVGDPSLHEKIAQGPLPGADTLQALVATHALGHTQEAEWLYGQGRISRSHKPKQFVGDPELGHYAWPLIGRAVGLELADLPGPVALIREVVDETEALTLAQKAPFAVMLYTENSTYTEPFMAAVQARWAGLNVPASGVEVIAYGGHWPGLEGNAVVSSPRAQDPCLHALLEALSSP